MIVIADNLNTRNRAFMSALKARNENAISELVKRLSHADMINLQCSLDGSEDEETLPWLVEVTLKTVSSLISLDSRNVHALRRVVPLCPQPPLINFISYTEPEDPEELLALVASSGASLVLRASRSTPPTSLEGKLQIIEELLEMANAHDIPNERLFGDPSLIHIGGGEGQKHLANSTECIKLLKELIEPPIKTIAWVSNVSSGMPFALRKSIEASFFLYAGGAGLDAGMLDVLDPSIKKAIYFVKSFRDEIVFSPADIT
ncbi:MAG: dihydropteroate synthase [Nitrospirae bacterium]|nr:dihydropteroate synthase [Nitrospirota bacterium]